MQDWLQIHVGTKVKLRRIYGDDIWKTVKDIVVHSKPELFDEQCDVFLRLDGGDSYPIYFVSEMLEE